MRNQLRCFYDNFCSIQAVIYQTSYSSLKSSIITVWYGDKLGVFHTLLKTTTEKYMIKTINKVRYQVTMYIYLAFISLLSTKFFIQKQGSIINIFVSDLACSRRCACEFPSCLPHAIKRSVSCYLCYGYSFRNFIQIFFCKFHHQRANIVIQILNLSCPWNSKANESQKNHIDFSWLMNSF